MLDYKWTSPSGKWIITFRSAQGLDDRTLEWLEFDVRCETDGKRHSCNVEVIYPGTKLLNGKAQKELEFNLIVPRGRRGGDVEIPMNVRSQMIQMAKAKQKEWYERITEPLSKEIVYFGRKTVATCDAWCEKAFGRNGRPKVQLDPANDDDVVYLPDTEVGTAPVDPGTYEGGHAKPVNPAYRLNKWCVRECERCVLTEPGEPVNLHDWFKPLFNIPREERVNNGRDIRAESTPTGA